MHLPIAGAAATEPSHDVQEHGVQANVITVQWLARGGRRTATLRLGERGYEIEVIRSGRDSNMSLKNWIYLTVLTLGLFVAALGAGQHAMADGASYPWCVSGENLQCWYTTRQQCEETVDYHGFCEANPDYTSQGNDASRRMHRQ